MVTGTEYLKFVSLFYWINGLRTLLDGILRGYGEMLVMTAANFLNLTLRVLGAFLLTPVFGIAAIWYCVAAGWCINFLICYQRYRVTSRWQALAMRQPPG